MSLRSTTLKLSAALIAALSIAIAVTHSNAQSLATASALKDSSFKPVPAPFRVSTGDKIEVAELFWFECGHCFSLEPSIKKWKKSMPENAKFVKVPAIFSKRWEFHGKAFYTMQSLSVPEAAYDAFFQRIHVQRKPVRSLGALVSFLAAYDKTEEQVTSAFNSFEVDSKVRAAAKISRQSGATGVPAIVVDGKYLTSQDMAGGVDQLFKTVDLLVEKAATER